MKKGSIEREEAKCEANERKHNQTFGEIGDRARLERGGRYHEIKLSAPGIKSM